jgi:hypothetical protein
MMWMRETGSLSCTRTAAPSLTRVGNSQTASSSYSPAAAHSLANESISAYATALAAHHSGHFSSAALTAAAAAAARALGVPAGPVSTQRLLCFALLLVPGSATDTLSGLLSVLHVGGKVRASAV